MADAAEGPALVGSHHALCRVFDHEQVALRGERHDRVHLAGNAAVVHRNDRARAWRNGTGDPGLVDVERIGPDIDEHGDTAAQHERVGGRHEGIRRHDHFIAWPDIRQDRRHLERRSAGMRQQRLATSGALFKPCVAAAGKRAVPRKVTLGMSLGDIPELLAGHVGLVERNIDGRQPAFLATVSNEPPNGKLTPRRIRARSKSSSLSRTAFVRPVIRNSSRGSNCRAGWRLTKRTISISGKRRETNDEVLATTKPALSTLILSSATV